MDAVENQRQVSHRAHSPWNRKLRDSHIPTAATKSGKVENEKRVSHFPAHCLLLFFKDSERRPGSGSLRSRSRLILR